MLESACSYYLSIKPTERFTDKFKFYRNYLTLDSHTNTVFGGVFAAITHDSTLHSMK